MTRFRFSGLRARLLLLVVLSVLPALGLILSTAFREHSLAAQRAREEVQQLAEFAALEQEQLVAGTHELLVVLAQTPSVRQGRPDRYGALFRDVMKRSPWFANLAVVKPDGEILFSVVPTSGPARLLERSHIRRAIEVREFAIGDFHTDRLTRKPTIAFAYPVLGDTSQVVSLVTADLGLDWLNQEEFRIEAQLPTAATLAILDGDGIVLAHNLYPERWVGRRVLDKPLFQNIVTQREGLTEAAGLDGIPRFYAFMPVRSRLKAGDIFVVVGITKAGAFADLNRALGHSLFWFGLVTVLAVAAAWFGANVFVLRQLRTLLHATDQLSAGDLRARTGPPYGRGEIGQLSHAFDQMADALEQRDAERRRAEEQQKALSTGLHAVVETADELIACADLDTLYRRAVELARERLGLERCAIFLEKDGCFQGTYGTALSRNTTDEHTNLFPAETSVWYQSLCALKQEGRRWTVVEESLREWDGERSVVVGRGWVAVTPIESRFAERHIGVLIADAAISHSDFDPARQEVVAVFCSLLGNIVERKFAEEALRRREEYFRSLIENTSDMILIQNADGTIRYISPAVERVLAYSPEEMVGKHPREFFHPDEAPSLEAIFADAIQKPGFTAVADFWLRRKDGSWAAIEGVGKNLLHNPAVGGFVASLRDITERKQLEERLRQSQKMEAVGKLAGGVAHDFNNILTTITGYSDLVLSRLNESDPLFKDVFEIRKAGERATSLTRQLLAFSRRQVLQPKVIRVNRVIAEMDRMLQRLIGEDIDLVTVLDAQLGCIKVDPGQIEQVVLNLAINARDAMPNGGRLTIETSNVELDEAYARRHTDVLPGPYVLIAVSDTGCGMDEGTKSRIFEPFFTTKEVGKGTGLGLSMIYGIVRQSGGHIWVYSEAGRGTTFKIYFPRVEGPPEEFETLGQRAALARGTETVLLVEDEAEVRKLVREILEMNGYKVLEVDRGSKAIEIGKRCEEPIHLMITDVVMPGMSGRELAQRLAPVRPQMRVLYMSGYTENAIVHHGVLDEETAFIQKPFTPAALALKVRHVLDKTPQTDKG